MRKTRIYIFFRKRVRKFARFLKKYSVTLQTFCSIISVTLIAAITISIAINANKISASQLEISKAENRPIFTFDITQNDDGNDEFDIFCRGAYPTVFKVDFITYFEFYNKENDYGKEPLRIYTPNDNNKMYKGEEENCIATFYLYDANCELISEISKEIAELSSVVDDNIWKTDFVYLIIVNYMDVFNEPDYVYYQFDGHNGYLVSKEFGDEIVKEYEYSTQGLHEDEFNFKKQNRLYYYVDTMDTKILFSDAVSLMRSKNLYGKDSNSKTIYYGNYEPNHKN